MKKNTFPKLRGKMAEFGYTTATFAKALGICKDSAYRKLRRQVDFTLTETYLILKLFDCSFEEIFTEEDFEHVRKEKNNPENQKDELKTVN